jgi:hypothetical protein
MNIDQLRSAWQEQPTMQVTQNRWAEMLKNESRNPIAKLKNRTRYQSIMSGILGIAMIVWLVFIENMPLAAIVYVPMGVYSFFYSRRQMQLIINMEKLDGDVRHTLEEHINALQRFFNRHLLYVTLLTPGFFFFMGWLIYRQTGEMPISDFPATYPEAVLPYSGFILFMTVLFYVMSRIMTKMKYGKHMDQLRRKAAQLQEEFS